MSNLTDIKDSNNIIWLEQAAKNGDSNAINSLAKCYENGEGIEKNLEKAFHWFQKAAENGNEKAQYNFARLYYNGEGTEKNLERPFIGVKKQLKMVMRKHNPILQRYTLLEKEQKRI